RFSGSEFLYTGLRFLLSPVVLRCASLGPILIFDAMGNDSKSTCKVASHHLFKDKAKNRVEDLHLMFTDIQLARRESRSGDVAILEEQVHQMLREWQAELTEPSPATSLHANSLGSFSTELGRLLREIEEEDDAISPLKHGPEIHPSKAGETVAFKEAGHFNCINEGGGFQGFQQFNDSTPAFHNTITTNLEPSTFIHGTPITSETEASLFQHNTDSLLEASNFHHTSISTDTDYFQYSENEIYISSSSVEQFGADGFSDVSGLLLMNIHPSPSAFLGPKCALWDCDRPVQGSDWCQHYCSTFHATLAAKEGPPGMAPLLRPGGINLKDGPLFVALRAKIEGKDVGIPECGGAATSKSPWNAPELFDSYLLEGETIREWLFFDKPRRAFECGNRKQRSLPDYNGRGWHESRKQVMKEFGGWKRSYYMDPQPLNNYHWHLFEYELENCNVCALYRLELKLVEAKKSPKGRVMKDSLADLQKRMGRLTADAPIDDKSSGKGKAKGNIKPELESVLHSSVVSISSQFTGDTIDMSDLPESIKRIASFEIREKDKPLLAGGVPNLGFNDLIINVNAASGEFNSDCGLGFEAELITSESGEEI
ncbi:hypothetical protein V2J09_002730, partial [Rumex salicifolius]